MAGKVEHLELNNKVNLKKVNQKWQEKLNICNQIIKLIKTIKNGVK